MTTPNGTAAAPYVKAATRDSKAYMNSKGGRYIPMGYSAADIASIRPMFQDYLVCGPVNETVDFFAVNIYEWVPSPLDPLLSPTMLTFVCVVRRLIVRHFRIL